MNAADGRLVADVVGWLFGEVFLDVRFKPADQRSSSIRLSVAELMTGLLWWKACKSELLGSQFVMLANW